MGACLARWAGLVRLGAAARSLSVGCCCPCGAWRAEPLADHSRGLHSPPAPQGDSLSAPQYRSTLDCLRQSVAVEGRQGLFRGFGAAMYRAIPVNAGIFLAVEGTRQLLAKYDTLEAAEELRSPAPVPAGQAMVASTPSPAQ